MNIINITQISIEGNCRLYQQNMKKSNLKIQTYPSRQLHVQS